MPDQEPKQPKKRYVTPEFRQVTPYAEMIKILRSALKVAEGAAALNPNDQQAVQQAKSLRRDLDDLESRHDAA
jgi:hypothetical protein